MLMIAYSNESYRELDHEDAGPAVAERNNPDEAVAGTARPLAWAARHFTRQVAWARRRLDPATPTGLWH
jgi:hypothetical protein